MVRSLKWASILSFSFVRQSYQRHFFRKFIQGYVPLANFKFLWYNSYGVLRQTSTLHLLFLSLFTRQGFLLEKIFLIFQILQTFLGNLPVWVNFWKIKSWFKHVNDNTVRSGQSTPCLPYLDWPISNRFLPLKIS